MIRSKLSLYILDMCCDPEGGEGGRGGADESRKRKNNTILFKYKFDFVSTLSRITCQF